MRKKRHEKSSPRHHKNSPREKTDGGTFYWGFGKRAPVRKKNNLRVGIHTKYRKFTHSVLKNFVIHLAICTKLHVSKPRLHVTINDCGQLQTWHYTKLRTQFFCILQWSHTSYLRKLDKNMQHKATPHKCCIHTTLILVNWKWKHSLMGFVQRVCEFEKPYESFCLKPSIFWENCIKLTFSGCPWNFTIEL